MLLYAPQFIRSDGSVLSIISNPSHDPSNRYGCQVSQNGVVCLPSTVFVGDNPITALKSFLASNDETMEHLNNAAAALWSAYEENSDLRYATLLNIDMDNNGLDVLGSEDDCSIERPAPIPQPAPQPVISEEPPRVGNYTGIGVKAPEEDKIQRAISHENADLQPACQARDRQPTQEEIEALANAGTINPSSARDDLDFSIEALQCLADRYLAEKAPFSAACVYEALASLLRIGG